MEDLYLVLAKLDPELGTAQPQLVFIVNVYKMVYFYITACHVFQIQNLVVGSFGIV